MCRVLARAYAAVALMHVVRGLGARLRGARLSVPFNLHEAAAAIAVRAARLSAWENEVELPTADELGRVMRSYDRCVVGWAALPVLGFDPAVVAAAYTGWRRAVSPRLVATRMKRLPSLQCVACKRPVDARTAICVRAFPRLAS